VNVARPNTDYHHSFVHSEKYLGLNYKMHKWKEKKNLTYAIHTHFVALYSLLYVNILYICVVFLQRNFKENVSDKSDAKKVNQVLWVIK